MRTTLCTIAALLSFTATLSAAAPEFHESIEAARDASKVDKPVVVSFGASWCGWCQKMKVDTFQSPEVAEIADRFLWVKIDIDDQAALAARYGVRGVPHTVVLNEKGQLLGGRPAYMTPAQLIEFVTSSLENPPVVDAADQLLEQFTSAPDGESLREATGKLIELLATPDRANRERLTAALTRKGDVVWPLLVELLNDRRLAIRAVAGDTLRRLTQAQLPFHPFAAADARQRQVDGWSSWVATALQQPR